MDVDFKRFEKSPPTLFVEQKLTMGCYLIKSLFPVSGKAITKATGHFRLHFTVCELLTNDWNDDNPDKFCIKVGGW
jgi:hypothetical protein